MLSHLCVRFALEPKVDPVSGKVKNAFEDPLRRVDVRDVDYPQLEMNDRGVLVQIVGVGFIRCVIRGLLVLDRKAATRSGIKIKVPTELTLTLRS